MHCAFVEKINYLDYYLTLNLQRRFVLSKISKTANSHIIFDGLPRSQTKLQPNEVPGLLEAGWTPDMDKFAEKRHKKPKQGLAKVLADIVEALESSSHAWPFATPVTGVEGYYEVIQDPMGNFRRSFSLQYRFFTLLRSRFANAPPKYRR